MLSMLASKVCKQPGLSSLWRLQPASSALLESLSWETASVGDCKPSCSGRQFQGQLCNQRVFSSTTNVWPPAIGRFPRLQASLATSRPQPQPPPLIISPTACRVVVIGWMGCSKRYLAKYGQLWARSGDHEVLLIRPTIMQTFVRWRGVVMAGYDLDRVARMHRECPAMPTIYHIFSMGGFIHAATLWGWIDQVEDRAQRRGLQEEVRGIILDSCPAPVTSDMAAGAFIAALTGTHAESFLPRPPPTPTRAHTLLHVDHDAPIAAAPTAYDYTHPHLAPRAHSHAQASSSDRLAHGDGHGLRSHPAGRLTERVRPVFEWWLQRRGPVLRAEEVYSAWYDLAPACPQLYLYSESDPLVPAVEVERYMALQAGRGVSVSGYKWADSPHCAHYRAHPHEYAYQVSNFLAAALKSW